MPTANPIPMQRPEHERKRQRFSGAPLIRMGRQAHLRLSGRRHQRRHRRAEPGRGQDRVRPGAARGDGRLHGLRPRQIHRRGRRLPRHLGPRRHPPAERPVRREARPSAGGRDRRPAEARRAGRRLPAGSRPRLAVQGRGADYVQMATYPGADAPPGRPRDAHRPGRTHRHLHHRPERLQEMERRSRRRTSMAPCIRGSATRRRACAPEPRICSARPTC